MIHNTMIHNLPAPPYSVWSTSRWGVGYPAGCRIQSWTQVIGSPPPRPEHLQKEAKRTMRGSSRVSDPYRTVLHYSTSMQYVRHWMKKWNISNAWPRFGASPWKAAVSHGNGEDPWRHSRFPANRGITSNVSSYSTLLRIVLYGTVWYCSYETYGRDNNELEGRPFLFSVPSRIGQLLMGLCCTIILISWEES
jgi:hypothetical protein